MINSSTNNTSDWLERLKHPERKEPKRRRMTRNLFIRNILNALFIIVALVAIIGIIVAKEHVMVWYGSNEKPPIGDSCLLGISTRFLKRIVRCSTIIIVLI